MNGDNYCQSVCLTCHGHITISVLECACLKRERSLCNIQSCIIKWATYCTEPDVIMTPFHEKPTVTYKKYMLHQLGQFKQWFPVSEQWSSTWSFKICYYTRKNKIQLDDSIQAIIDCLFSNDIDLAQSRQHTDFELL